MQTRVWVLGAATLGLLAAGAIFRSQSTAQRVPFAAHSVESPEPSHPNAASSNEPAGTAGVPGRVSPRPSTTTHLRSPSVEARRATRERADSIRRKLDERRRSARAPVVPAAAGPEAEKADAERRRAFIQKAVREQYIPVAKSCYEELLARLPKAAGKVVLYFSIAGDEESGGVVDHVETRDGTTFDDPEFLLCMRESMYSTLFDPPPNGGETTIEYPLELSP
jgi:hypothetical protein